MEQTMMNIVLTKKPHELLLQAPPFLFIDKVLEFDGKEESILCAKYLAYNEPYFSGHFPGEPIFPGVLIIEMSAQASMLLILGIMNLDKPQVGYLVRTNKFSFINPVYPGDCLNVRATMVKTIGNFMTTKIEVASVSSNKIAAKGELVLSISK
ncbi:beta-hydroxyacyl-ACP dehydratase [Bacillus velezensis]|mgnify:CR=1 FL=1|uniref:3-hydroxyacyl-ACP dehydratase FabZ family protein n=1 Tax=Bacillus velezensis TaxID=492670 RepID=UPI000CE07228|nr:3-hydroxyacyl-ACP dehydratase FabZ family protein [Bacillus velezensis]AVB08628.1 beta-hydroxyacyl-ACP dehydratase [Bacillus velezensis]MCV2522137.1 beta-hydroxyacyl-ACP dehydratase [Bacillus velezensis]MEC0383901.1 beta-hydroxyacyl-ACP dehydratase [Bacillus velezensis]MEC0387992.1 beta-hydroxyacyl-ACP dehydratase [Bacillus velezensis]MEC3923648.1 3-hydroxyacyl-ACP dehydratase FabZ family protein [Bacillus velezensis]